MLATGALTDVTLNARGTSVKAHRLVLASCSQYFAELFKEIEAENNTLVVVLGCEAAELRLLLTFMYTGEVTASKKVLPSLLRLAQTLKVSGLTDADTNSAVTPNENEEPSNDQHTAMPVNLGHKNDEYPIDDDMSNAQPNIDDISPTDDLKDYTGDFIRNEKNRLSKLDQIVQNLYSTHKIGNLPPTSTTPTTPVLPGLDTTDYDRKWRTNNSVCSVCGKRLSNQYNLRVHMETHLGRRHACRACAHVSRSRDALRKHVAYRHAPAHT